jgi:hypothetical protein
MKRLTLQTDAPTASQPGVRDDRETPLCGQAETARNVNVICPTVQAMRVRQTGTTGNLCMRGLRKLPVVQVRFASSSAQARQRQGREWIEHRYAQRLELPGIAGQGCQPMVLGRRR